MRNVICPSIFRHNTSSLMLLSTVDFKRINAFWPKKNIIIHSFFFFFTKAGETHDCEVRPLTGVCVWMACGWAAGALSWLLSVCHGKSFIHLNSFKQNSISGCNFSSDLNTFPFLIDFCTWMFCCLLCFQLNVDSSPPGHHTSNVCMVLCDHSR